MLPKIEHPIFETILPLSKQKVKFRPILVKEEKILLIAKEEGTLQAMLEAIRGILGNCAPEVKVDDLPLVDVEWLFLQLRIKSIGRVIECKVIDPTDENSYDVVIDLEKAELSNTNYNPVIKFTDEIGVKMKLPTIGDLANLIEYNKSKDIFTLDLVYKMIEFVFTGDDVVFRASDYTHEELQEFVDHLQPPHIDQLSEFFLNLPRLVVKYSYTRKDGTVAEWEADNLQSFFT